MPGIIEGLEVWYAVIAALMTMRAVICANRAIDLRRCQTHIRDIAYFIIITPSPRAISFTMPSSIAASLASLAHIDVDAGRGATMVYLTMLMPTEPPITRAASWHETLYARVTVLLSGRDVQYKLVHRSLSIYSLFSISPTPDFIDRIYIFDCLDFYMIGQHLA